MACKNCDGSGFIKNMNGQHIAACIAHDYGFSSPPPPSPPLPPSKGWTLTSAIMMFGLCYGLTLFLVTWDTGKSASEVIDTDNLHKICLIVGAIAGVLHPIVSKVMEFIIKAGVILAILAGSYLLLQ